MSDCTFIGIDPGTSGGLGVIASDGTRAHAFAKLTERDIYDILTVEKRGACLAVVERVAAFPGQGVSSTFKFGRSYGFLRGCLIASEIPFEEVSPQVWQKELGCLSRGEKNRTKARAQQLFPGLKITHATADALLLAEYARRLYLRRNGDAAP